MPIRVAKTAGFCFGVERAVRFVEQALDEGRRVATLGPIIHNPQVVEALAFRGVKIYETVAAIPNGYTVVLRSHGVVQEVYRELAQRNLSYVDATCPFVAKIHTLVRDASAEGKTVLLAGDEKHPEMAGVISCCVGDWHCFSTADDLEAFLLSALFSVKKTYILVAQTTFNILEWQKCIDIIKKVCTNSIIFDTICNATTLRQKEAEEISRMSDLMIVVGGRTSSNTRKLAQICTGNCPTLHVETAAELRSYHFGGRVRIGVTAGASTPASIIKEVRKTMDEMTNQQDEMSFEEMLEQSLKAVYTRERVTGVVTNVAPNELAVDIGTKHAGYVPLGEFTDDPAAKLEELVNVGDELELIVLRVNDVEGTAMLSKKRVDAIAGFERVIEAEEKGETLEGVVVEMVKGGLIALTNGVRVFIPASQATISRNQELDGLLKQTVQFKILETNKNRRRAVASIRAVLKDQKKELEEKFWETVEPGKVYLGNVKSLTSYGAFVDLGGVDGMVHITELSWSRIKHPSDVVKAGDTLEVYIKDIDRENHKISLGYKKTEDNPWAILQRDYKAGDVVTARIVSMTPFGAFAQIIPGVDGLIHISQIAGERINKPSDVLSVGQEVQVKITDIDFEKKRLSLSIRALLEKEAPKDAAPPEEKAPEVYTAGPDGHIGQAPEPAEAAPAEVPAAPAEAESIPAVQEEAPAPAEEPTPVEEPVLTEETAPVEEPASPEEAPSNAEQA